MPLAADVHLEVLAEQTDGFTGADVAACCQEAALGALEENIDVVCVGMVQFVTAVSSQRQRLNRSMHNT